MRGLNRCPATALIEKSIPQFESEMFRQYGNEMKREDNIQGFALNDVLGMYADNGEFSPSPEDLKPKVDRLAHAMRVFHQSERYFNECLYELESEVEKEVVSRRLNHP